jgi:hypothetical protein
MGTGAATAQARASNDLLSKQIEEQKAQEKQKRQALFSDELETLKSSGQAHLDTQSNTDQGAF